MKDVNNIMQKYDYWNLHARFVQPQRKNTSTMIKHNKIYKKLGSLPCYTDNHIISLVRGTMQ